MTEPDELYTLRAQYWLGHYQSAVDEARSVSRRPMPPHLKLEREEFLARSYLALGQYDRVSNRESPGTSILSCALFLALFLVIFFEEI
jgi:coatomer protein complex subunit epsilon